MLKSDHLPGRKRTRNSFTFTFVNYKWEKLSVLDVKKSVHDKKLLLLDSFVMHYENFLQIFTFHHSNEDVSERWR